MISFPNCKINLGLSVLNKRTDGFHNLETVFYPLLLKDILEVIESEKESEFSTSGLNIKGNENDNLCLKAYNLLKKDFPDLPTVKIHLHKAIPMGAGLGGGSANGAFMLQLLNNKFKLGLSTEKLIEYSLQLGSDCPFFQINKPCIANGRGEILEQIDLDLSSFKFLIVVPDIHINTSGAFSELNLQSKVDPPGKIKNIISQSIETWKDLLVNDFEKIIFSKHPETSLIKEKLYEAGATYASLSGSGSAVYGIFKKEMEINIVFPQTYYKKLLNAGKTESWKENGI